MSKPIPDLPGDWTCDGCGQTAERSACIWPLDQVDTSDRDTLEVYGKWKGDELIEAPEGMFSNGIAIECCGNCGRGCWSAPKCVAVTT